MKVSVEEGRRIIISKVKPINETKRVLVDESLGRVLKETIIAGRNYPKHNISRFDGYALKSDDLEKNAGLSVVEKSELEEGECRRVKTGGRIPRNADVVVTVEDVQEKNNSITLGKMPSSRNIIEKGSNVEKGQKILESESVIDEVNIGVFPTLEREKAEVYRKTKAGIVATGGEITPENDVNSRLLSGLVNKDGGYVDCVARVNDDEEQIEKKILGLVGSDHDLITTIGGTSKGRHDHVDEVLSDIGEIFFDGVKMGPGKTFTFGEIKDTPVLSFSGNVTPCLIQAHLFLVPVLRYMSHLPKRERFQLKANETISVESHKIMKKGACKALPARIVNEKKVEPVFGKYMTIMPFLNSNCLLVIGEDKDRIKEGEKVGVIPLEISKL